MTDIDLLKLAVKVVGDYKDGLATSDADDRRDLSIYEFTHGLKDKGLCELFDLIEEISYMQVMT